MVDDAIVESGSLPGFSRSQVSVVVGMGLLASLVVVLQPVVLAPLQVEGRLTLAEMGRTAMFESLGMAIAVTLGGIFLRPRGLRYIAALAAITSVLANLLSASDSHEVIELSRLANGVTVGVLLWVWTGLLTNIALPSRNVAIFVALQATCGLILSWLLPNYVVPLWGGSGVYLIMAGLSALNVFLAPFVPASYPERERLAAPRIQLPSLRGLAGLVAVTINLGGTLAVWVYAVPLGRQFGLSLPLVSTVVSVGIGSQILGGLAGAVGARMDSQKTIYASIAACLLGVGLIASGAGLYSFLAGLIIIGFFLMFTSCFHMGYLLEIDPGRGAGMQMISAQQLGFACGPLLASVVISDGNMTPALVISAVLYVGAATLVALTTWISRRGAAGRMAYR